LAVKLPLSSIVAQLSCISFPVTSSYLAIALSVAPAGHTTSPDQDHVLLIIGLLGSVSSTVILIPATTESSLPSISV